MIGAALGGCTSAPVCELIPAEAQLVIHVRPEALIRNQLRPSEWLSPAFWRLMEQSRAQAGSRNWNGQLIEGDFWGFTVPRVPDHYFFIYPTPQQTDFLGINPAFRSRPVDGADLSVGVFSPAGQVSPGAFRYLVDVASRQAPVWQPNQAVRTVLSEDSHLLIYSPAMPKDTGLLAGHSLLHLYFADGVARGRLRFFPGAEGSLRGAALFAPSISMRPVGEAKTGTQMAFSLDKDALHTVLARSTAWKGLSAMAEFMGLPLQDLAASSGRDVYACSSPTGSLALATVDEPTRMRRALLRMRRNGALTGDRPPYEFMGQDDWSLQTRAGRLELRQGTPPVLPGMARCQGRGAWAHLDSVGLRKVADFFDLGRHPMARHLLPWMRTLDLELSSYPDGSLAGAFTFRHTFRAADMLAQGDDPVAVFLEGGR